MIGIGLALTGQGFAGGSPRILLSAHAIDANRPAGTEIATVSIDNASSGPWSFALENDAEGKFALSGDTLVTGTAALDHDTAPSPQVVLSATDGKRSLRQAFVIAVRRPLPALPLAAGAKVVGLGHSFIQRGGWGIGDTYPSDVSSSQIRAALPWVRLRDNRFNLDLWGDINNRLGSNNALDGAFQGYGGDHIVAEGGAPGTIERTPHVATLRPGIVYLDIGTNDINSGDGVTSAAHVIVRLDKQLELLRNEGIWTVIQTITDRGAWPEGSRKAAIVAGVNEWIKAQADRDGVRICDLTGAGFNLPDFDTSLFGGDVLHPNPKGAERMAAILLPILQDMVAAGEHADLTDASTVFSASNLWPDAAFAATVAATGTGISGTRVSTLTIARQSGDSSIVSSVENMGTYKKQVLTFTPSDNTSGSRIDDWRIRKPANLLLSTLGITPGSDWLEAGIFVEMNAWAGWLSCIWQMEFHNGSAYVFTARGGLINSDSATQDLPLESNGFTGWLKIPPFQIPVEANATTLMASVRPFSVSINRQATGQGVIKLSRPFLRKTADPRPAWKAPA